MGFYPYPGDGRGLDKYQNGRIVKGCPAPVWFVFNYSWYLCQNEYNLKLWDKINIITITLQLVLDYLVVFESIFIIKNLIV